jgi:hypothetical protein
MLMLMQMQMQGGSGKEEEEEKEEGNRAKREREAIGYSPFSDGDYIKQQGGEGSCSSSLEGTGVG